MVWPSAALLPSHIIQTEQATFTMKRLGPMLTRKLCREGFWSWKQRVLKFNEELEQDAESSFKKKKNELLPFVVFFFKELGDLGQFCLCREHRLYSVIISKGARSQHDAKNILNIAY